MKTNKQRCCMLDKNGRRGRSNSIDSHDIHFDDELYTWFDKPGCQWGRIPVCKKHIKVFVK